MITNKARFADGGTLISSCDLVFDLGATYLLYGKGKNGQYRTSDCSRSRKMSAAGDDLKILGAGRVPVSQTSSNTGEEP